MYFLLINLNRKDHATENMKNVGPGPTNIRPDRQIFGRTDNFFLNLSVRLTDKTVPIILGEFMPDR